MSDRALTRLFKLLRLHTTARGEAVRDLYWEHRMRWWPTTSDLAEALEQEDEPTAARTYYDKGKNAEWFEGLSDREFARRCSDVAMDLADSDIDSVECWVPIVAVVDGAADRINRLIVEIDTLKGKDTALTGLPSLVARGCTCQGCFEVYEGDLLVPDEVWERIKPAGAAEGAGLLCARCIVERAVKQGIWTAAVAVNAEQVRSEVLGTTVMVLDNRHAR